MKIISWNLLRLDGAAVADVATLVERERPDLLLMQEATPELESLPELVGGHIYHQMLPGRIYGLAAWSPHPLSSPKSLALPISPMPCGLAPRLAQIVESGGVTFVNVHLSHGQILNRRQLNCIAQSLEGPAAIIGDFNAVGPILLPGYRDVGPRRVTHVASNVVPFRLDRCLVRDLACVEARALRRGPSDHRPIILDLRPADEVARSFVSQLILVSVIGGRSRSIPRGLWRRDARTAGGLIRRARKGGLRQPLVAEPGGIGEP